MISFGHEWGDSSMTDAVAEGMNKMEEILHVAYWNACFFFKETCFCFDQNFTKVVQYLLPNKSTLVPVMAWHLKLWDVNY